MPKTRAQKEEIVKDFDDRLKKMKAAVFVDYTGVAVKQVQDLKKQLLTEKADFGVMQNRLFAIALKENKLEVPAEVLDKPLAISFGYQDEVAPSRIIKQFSKQNKVLKILGGFFEGKFVGADVISQLASLPSHEELLAKFVYTINAPVSGFVNVLRGNISGLVNVLNQIKDNK